MFRTALTLTLSFAFPTAGLAMDLSLEPCINGGVSSSGNYPSQQTEDYVRTQLDWRSYYLDRLSERREDPPQGEATERRPPVAHTN